MTQLNAIALVSTAANQNAEHPDLCRFGGRYNYEVGAEWTREKTATPKALRAAVLAVLKADQEKGSIPSKKGGVTYGVRVKRYGYRLGVRVEIRGMTAGIINPDYVRLMELHGMSCGRSRYTENATAILDGVRSALARINYDRSDIQTDYFDVGFSVDVVFEGDTARAEYEAIAAALVR